MLQIPSKTSLHGCRTCNYDICANCVSLLVPSPFLLQSTPYSVQSSPFSKAAPFPLLHQAKFVCDVTLADGSFVHPGERLEKTWRIRNTGESAWPVGTKILHVGGDILGGPVQGKEIPFNVKPGDMVNLTVDLLMPTQPGRYTSYWRLTTPHPQCAKFGHRFWVSLTVLAPPALTVKPVRPPPPAMPIEYDDEEARSISTIVDFGFTDLNKIKKFLKEEKGVVGNTIDRLLADKQ